jgi:mono/diheme cytochrome c family protein
LDISPAPINTTGMTSAQIEAIGQGSYLVNAVAACASCHGEAGTTPGFLAGTTAAGSFNARNLTPDATTGMKLTEAQFIDVMRIGADFACTSGGCTATGFTISSMAWPDFRWASTSDLQAMYAYLKAIPAVSNLVAADTGTHATATAPFPTTFVDGSVQRPLPAEVDASGKPIPDPDFVRRGMAIQPLAQVTSSDPAADVLIGRGSYLVNSLGRCNGCHTNPARTTTSATSPINVAVWFTGGKVSSFTGAAQISTGVVRSMSTDLVGATNGFFGESATDLATFEGIIQTGSHIDDAMASPLAAPMPWQHLRDLTVQDFEAIYAYLHQVQQQQPSPLTGDKATQDASYYCVDNTTCDTGNGETCDLVGASVTFHECIGRACPGGNGDCRACQTCTTGTCGGPVIAACKSSGL